MDDILEDTEGNIGKALKKGRDYVLKGQIVARRRHLKRDASNYFRYSYGMPLDDYLTLVLPPFCRNIFNIFFH